MHTIEIEINAEYHFLCMKCVKTSTENIYERIFCYISMQCVFDFACVENFKNLQTEASDYALKSNLQNLFFGYGILDWIGKPS